MAASPGVAGRRIIFHDASPSAWQRARSVPQADAAAGGAPLPAPQGEGGRETEPSEPWREETRLSQCLRVSGGLFCHPV